MSILKGCKPRRDVLHGDRDDAIFAADFGSLIAGDRCPEVYRDAGKFFANTHPAAQLKKVVQVVFGRLADTKEPGALGEVAATARPATMLRATRCTLCPVVRCRDPDHGKVIGMSKSKDTKKEQKKAPQKTAKEKKQAKRDKQGKSSSVLSKTAGS